MYKLSANGFCTCCTSPVLWINDQAHFAIFHGIFALERLKKYIRLPLLGCTCFTSRCWKGDRRSNLGEFLKYPQALMNLLSSVAVFEPRLHSLHLKAQAKCPKLLKPFHRWDACSVAAVIQRSPHCTTVPGVSLLETRSTKTCMKSQPEI